MTSTISESELLGAAQHGNLETIKEWHQQHQQTQVDNIRDWSNSTILISACYHGQLPTIKYLVEMCGASIVSANKYGSNALHVASWCGHLNVVKYLVESCSADASILNFSRNNALHDACLRGHAQVAQYLLENCEVHVLDKNNGNQTPLQCAIDNGHSGVVEVIALHMQTTVEQNQKDVKSGRSSANASDTTSPMNHTSASINRSRLESLASGDLADITFLVGQGEGQQSIKANSAILLATVPSLKTMLDDGIKHQPQQDLPTETACICTSTSTCTILLPNYTPAHVQYVLQYIYAGDYSFIFKAGMEHQQEVKSLLVVANHFDCLQLSLVLELQLIKEHLQDQTMVELLIFADVHGFKLLRSAAIQMVAEDADILLDHPHFCKLVEKIELMDKIRSARIGGAAKHRASDINMSILELFNFFDTQNCSVSGAGERSLMEASLLSKCMEEAPPKDED